MRARRKSRGGAVASRWRAGTAQPAGEIESLNEQRAATSLSLPQCRLGWDQARLARGQSRPQARGAAKRQVRSRALRTARTCGSTQPSCPHSPAPRADRDFASGTVELCAQSPGFAPRLGERRLGALTGG